MKAFGKGHNGPFLFYMEKMMNEIKYYYKAFGNRDLDEKEQGYALVTLVSAASKSMISNHLVSHAIKSGKKEVEVDFAKKSLEINQKHCPKVYNVRNPLTDELHNELTINQLYEYGEFAELYEELSNAIGDVNILKEGLKKK